MSQSKTPATDWLKEYVKHLPPACKGMDYEMAIWANAAHLEQTERIAQALEGIYMILDAANSKM